VICYLRPFVSAPEVPPWLEGWEGRPGVALCHRDTDQGHIVAVGNPLLLDVPKRGWLEGEAFGWKVGRLGKTIEPAHLARSVPWVIDTTPVADMSGRQWAVPIILGPAGTRAFRVAYGTNWLPALTPEQERAEAIATEARGALLSIGEAGGGSIDLAVACQWAAELLCLTHHLTPEVIQVLNLLDDVLVVSVLRAAVSL